MKLRHSGRRIKRVIPLGKRTAGLQSAYNDPLYAPVKVVPLTCILRGLEEIARYLRVDKRTVRRWMNECALPCMQTPGRMWITSPTLIDSWILVCNEY